MIGSGQSLNSLDSKPIQMAFDFVREIIEFINKMVVAQTCQASSSAPRESQSSLEQQIKGQEQTPQFKFDKNFSTTLQYYCDELQAVIQNIQFVLSVRQNQMTAMQANRLNLADRPSALEEIQSYQQKSVPPPNGFSLSAFLKASHRLRSMCLVSGYLVQKYGRLKAYVSTYKINTKFGAAESQMKEPISQTWKQMFSDCQLIVRYSHRRGRFLLEIQSGEEGVNQSLHESHDHYGFVPQVVKKPKITFDLTYKTGGFTSNSTKQQKQNKQVAGQIQAAQSQHSQLLELLEQLSPNDTLVWSNTTGSGKAVEAKDHVELSQN